MCKRKQIIEVIARSIMGEPPDWSGIENLLPRGTVVRKTRGWRVVELTDNNSVSIIELVRAGVDRVDDFAQTSISIKELIQELIANIKEKEKDDTRISTYITRRSHDEFEFYLVQVEAWNYDYDSPHFYTYLLIKESYVPKIVKELEKAINRNSKLFVHLRR